MLKTVELVEKIGKEYEPMLKQINIPDFYKCIAQYAGIPIQELHDNIILEYLTLWAKNKLHIFNFFGKKTKVDMDISYEDQDRDYLGKLRTIGRKYPVYYTWLDNLGNTRKNVLEEKNIGWDLRRAIYECFPDYKYNGETVTHFFKNKLNAPDSLVNELGGVYENEVIEGRFTLSIDPTDIMLSSENPYKWVSCYRLATDNEESHADGCLAGVLDSATIVTYIWTDEGKFTLYDLYKFKNIRYKRMRMTIATNKEFNAIHFNAIYPGKTSLAEDFVKLVRTKVEDYFAERKGQASKWIRNEIDMYNTNTDTNVKCNRVYEQYGYSEYSNYSVWKLKDQEHYSDITVYNAKILCPDDCGEYYRGSYYDESDGLYYNGEGHVNENWYEEESDEVYCEVIDSYEDCNGECSSCAIWNRAHAECEIDNQPCSEDSNELEEDKDIDAFNPYEDNIVRCLHHPTILCKTCPRYKEHLASIQVKEDKD